MKPREFYELVKAVRAAQKEYFATRSREALEESKNLERQLDAEIQRVESIVAADGRETATQQQINFDNN